MTAVTGDLENEPFIDDQESGDTDDEDVEDQKDVEGRGGEETNRGAIAWAKYDRYYYQGKVVDVENIPDDVCKKLPTTKRYVIH